MHDSAKDEEFQGFRAQPARHPDAFRDLNAVSPPSVAPGHGPLEGSYPNEEVIETDRAILLDSGIFDATFYRVAAGLDAREDPARHYLLTGFKAGLEPSPGFDGAFLSPYYELAGFRGPPAIVYALFRAAGRATYANRAEAEIAASVVRSSELFDEAMYRGQVGLLNHDFDPALHYVLVGERIGMPPSEKFNPTYYGERYPDVAAAESCFLVHYVTYGRAEGRRARPVAAEQKKSVTLSRAKESILLISHEASATGAPIVALNLGQRLFDKYNIVTVLLRGGSLVESFDKISAQLICLADGDRNDVELKYIVSSILQETPIRYAIVNSIVSMDMLPHLGAAFVPTVTLIHEFASYQRPYGPIREALGWMTEPVFSTEVTADSFRRDHPALLQRRIHVLPQGKTTVTSRPDSHTSDRQRLEAAMRPEGEDDTLVVFGAGTVHLRKGVDLFLATAMAARNHLGARRVRFVWIGHGYDPDRDLNYSVYLAEQIDRSGISDSVVLLDAVNDLEPAYAMADLFFLSSRLDPLPNVAIDAAMRGLPVICFDGASGFAEVLRRDSTAKLTIVPHLDTEAAARLIAELGRDQPLRQRIGEATRVLAETTFDMDLYAERIDDVGSQAIEAMRQRRADFDTIFNDESFDTGMSDSVEGQGMTREAAILRFLACWSAVRTAPHQVEHLAVRRPRAGFNPHIYSQHHPDLVHTEANPFADFLRKGQPDGPWLHDVIRPESCVGASCDHGLRVAIHAHFYYPELIGDFLAKISVNETQCDLLLSTNEKAKADELLLATSGYDRGNVNVTVVENRGRDIGPLLTGYGAQILHAYDVVGHFHGKRSLDLNPAMGETWREFLWQHLIGDYYPMMDIILSRFAKEDRLGLVFAEDPNLSYWGSNLTQAETLASQIGLDQPLPPFFEYPIGTMFWVRPRALAPLLGLNLDWTDYPQEPIANDGTILHSLERLVPFAANKGGFTWATTHVPGVTR